MSIHTDEGGNTLPDINLPPSPRSASEAQPREWRMSRRDLDALDTTGFVSAPKDVVFVREVLPDSRPQVAAISQENDLTHKITTDAAQSPPQPSGKGPTPRAMKWLRYYANIAEHPEAQELIKFIAATRAPEGRAITKEEEALIDACVIATSDPSASALKTMSRLLPLIDAVAATRPKAS